MKATVQDVTNLLEKVDSGELKVTNTVSYVHPETYMPWIQLTVVNKEGFSSLIAYPITIAQEAKRLIDNP